MNRIFRMLQNGFESQTRGSHKKAVSLFTDSTDKLRNHAIPALAALYVLFEPFFNAYLALNDAVQMLEGTYKGKTKSFENLIDALPDKLRLWEPPVRALFPEDSPEEMEIFPDKRTPFLKGTYEQRLGAMRVLRDKLTSLLVDNPSLTATRDDVAAYYTLCNTARQLQQGKEGSLGDLRSQRETQRVATANAFFGIIYGGLAQQFYTDIKRIGEYIDFPLLYDLITEELIGEVTLNGLNNIQNIPLTDVTVTAQKKFKVRVKSSTTGLVLAYFASNSTQGPNEPPQGIAVNAGDMVEATAEQMGWSATNTFLNLMNGQDTEVEVEVIEVF